MEYTMDTDDHVVIVTGGASGIGRATSRLFAEQGFRVVVADVQEEPRAGGTPTHHLIREQGGDAVFVETDVRDWDAVQSMVEQSLDAYGQIDVMVNNAGVSERAPIDELPVEDAQQIFRVNVDGVYHGMKAVMPHMKERGTGAIVNVSSGAGKTGIPELAAYCGSKFAVIGMTEAVARELEGHGVTVNAVCPGRTQTAMTDFDGVPPGTVAETILDVSNADYTGQAADI